MAHPDPERDVSSRSISAMGLQSCKVTGVRKENNRLVCDSCSHRRLAPCRDELHPIENPGRSGRQGNHGISPFDSTGADELAIRNQLGKSIPNVITQIWEDVSSMALNRLRSGCKTVSGGIVGICVFEVKGDAFR